MDPILTPIFTAILTSAALPTTIAGISIAGTLSTLTMGIISVAVMALLAPKAKKPEDGKVPLQQAVPPRIFAYGKCRLAGYVVLMEEYGAVLYQVSAICAHRCNAVTGFWLNDDIVTRTGIVVNGLADERYSRGSTYLEYTLGFDPEVTFTRLSPLYASGQWSSGYRGDGVASILMICASQNSKLQSKIFPAGRPLPSAEVETAILYDPRTDVLEYSDNTALEILHFLCYSEFGPQRSYADCILPVIDIWKTAADVCDETVALRAGGSELRYRSGGFDTTEHDTRTVLNELLTACDGWLCERGDGTIILTVGKYETPTQTITDDDIVGWTIQSDVPDEYAINEIATTFSFPDAGYSTTSVDPWEDTDDQAARGAKRSSRLELNFVQSFSQARRLGKRELTRQKERKRGQLVLNIGALGKIHSRWVNVQSSIVPFLSGAVIENRKAVISISTASITMDYIGGGSYIDDWDPAEDEGTAPIPPVSLLSVLVPDPTNVNATVEEAAGEAYVDISFDYHVYSGMTYVVEWRYSPSGAWVEVAYLSPPDAIGDRITLTLSPVPQGTSIDIAVCGVSTRGSRSAFSDPVTVSTVVAVAAPGTPTGGAASGGVGSAAVSWYNPNSETFSYSRVFRGGATDPFSSATVISSPIYGSANQFTEYTDTVSAGSYGYWVTAYNPGGSASTPAGPFTATVT